MLGLPAATQGGPLPKIEIILLWIFDVLNTMIFYFWSTYFLNTLFSKYFFLIFYFTNHGLYLHKLLSWSRWNWALDQLLING